MARYKYSPLNLSAKEIRLLTLLPGKSSNEVQILLHNTRLATDAPPSFEALSYVWGSTEDSQRIRVEADKASHITITKNLAVALPYLRYENKSRILWIDAICVDQENIRERGHQVQLMRDIFGLANRVVVWLGVDECDSSYALNLMDQLNSKIEVDWLAATMRPSLNGKNEPEWTDRTKLLPYEERELLALYSLLHRAWFERLWIRQEIRLANRDAIVMCGSTTIAWQAFRNALFCMRQKAKKREFLGSKAVPFHERIEMIYQMSDDASPMPLGRLLRQTKHCKCSDPRDRVYAMLSLLKKSERDMDIKVDYSLTTSQVYENLAIRFIDHFKSLKILASCEMQNQPRSMPTWVPDWSLGNLADPLWVPNADAQSIAVWKYLGNGILSVSGVQSATLSTAEEIFFKNSSNPELIAAILKYAPIDVISASYVDGGRLLDAYCRTLCCDNFGEGYLPDQDHFPHLEDSKAALLGFLNASSAYNTNVSTGSGAAKYLDWIWSFCQGRSFITTKEGYIGLAPKAAQPGDHVCVLLGCPSPLIFRPTKNLRYQVVGECYICGLMNGEAFLGPVPKDYRPVLLFDEFKKDHSPGFINIRTKASQEEDPRVGEGYLSNVKGRESSESGSKLRSILTPESLEQLGIYTQVFELE